MEGGGGGALPGSWQFWPGSHLYRESQGSERENNLPKGTQQVHRGDKIQAGSSKVLFILLTQLGELSPEFHSGKLPKAGADKERG